MNKLSYPALALVALLASCASIEEPEQIIQADTLTYPATPRSEQVDNYHGVMISDPYRWLEQTETSPVRNWVGNQNTFSESYLHSLGERSAVKQRLTQLWNYPETGTPFRYGRFYFHFQDNGLQNHPVLYVREGINSEPRELLDPNTLSSDGTISVARVAVSPNARYIAYALSEEGSDWVEVHIRDVQSGIDLGDKLSGIKFSNISWLPNDSGFYYSRYPDTPSGDANDQEAVAIYFHRVGNAQRSDRRIYDLSHYPAFNPYPTVTRDGRYLIATIDNASSANAVHILDLTRTDARWQPIFNEWDGNYTFIDSDANLLFFQTTANAPTGKVVAVDLSAAGNYRVEQLISPQAANLLDTRYIGGKFFAHYLSAEQSQLQVFNAYGRHENTVAFEEAGRIDTITGHAGHLEAFFTFSTFTHPGTTYRYDLTNHELEELNQSSSHFAAQRYITRQVEFTTPDGRSLNMFLVHHRDLTRNGQTPTILHSSGSLNAPITPYFSSANLLWLERGGILAVPGIGGIQATALESQQTASNDLIAAANYLIEEGYTNPGNLAAQGSGNGALILAHSMIQRPDLFAAVIPDSGVYDLLRFHTANANARAWSSEYGISSDPEQFSMLESFSPVHNIAQNCYPATLISTGMNNDEVAAWHSYKFVAALQQAQECDSSAPVLLRARPQAGRSATMPTWMRIDKASDQLAFLFEHLASSRLLSQKLQSTPQSSNLN